MDLNIKEDSNYTLGNRILGSCAFLRELNPGSLSLLSLESLNPSRDLRKRLELTLAAK